MDRFQNLFLQSYCWIRLQLAWVLELGVITPLEW